MTDAQAGQVRMLAALLPTFEAPNFAFGEWKGGDRLPDGTIQMPYYELSDAAERFRRAAAPLLRTDFDWPSWSKTSDFQRFDREPAAIGSASLEQVQQLLTVYIRAERFGDGTLESAFKRGVLTAILRRVAALSTDHGSAADDSSSRPYHDPQGPLAQR